MRYMDTIGVVRMILEYVWLDGNDVKNLRSKIKVMSVEEFPGFEPEHYPEWGFDGSSTNQAPGEKSDVILKPVRVIENPLFRPNSISGDLSLIVLCDVANPDGTPHESSTRAKLVELADKYAKHKMWFAFEQEYTIYDGDGTSPYRWPISGFPSPSIRS
jgi:glutamine synthetase